MRRSRRAGSGPDRLDSECDCKVGVGIRTYALTGFNDELTRYCSKEGDRTYSLRRLADYFNREVVRAAMRDADMNPLEGEAENVHRLLTDDEISSGMYVQVRKRLEQQGVDVDDLEADFVSYQTINRHIKRCLGLERASSKDDGTRRKRSAQHISALQQRTTAVTTSTLERLRAADEIAGGEFDVYVDITVTCATCGFHTEIKELLENGCQCDGPR